MISSISEDFYRPLFSQFYGQVDFCTLGTGYDAGDEYSEKTFVYFMMKSQQDGDSIGNQLQSALFDARQAKTHATKESEAAELHVESVRKAYAEATSDKLKHGKVVDKALEAWQPELAKELESLSERQTKEENKRAYQKNEHIALQVRLGSVCAFSLIMCAGICKVEGA